MTVQHALNHNGIKNVSLNTTSEEQRSEDGVLWRSRNDSVIRPDSWEKIDEEIREVTEQSLTGWMVLRQEGVVDTSLGIGDKFAIYDRFGDPQEVKVSMSGDAQTTKDRGTFDRQTTPVPVIHRGWEVGVRDAAASPDLNMVEMRRATRHISRKMDDILFNGSDLSVSVDGTQVSIDGFTNHSDRLNNTAGDFSTSADWNNTEGNIIPDVSAGLNALETAGFDGPFHLWLGNDVFGNTRQHQTNHKWIRSFLEDEMPELAGIHRTLHMSDEYVIASLNSDNVEGKVAEDIQAVDWTSDNQMREGHQVMFIGVTQLKPDKNDNLGVAHADSLHT